MGAEDLNARVTNCTRKASLFCTYDEGMFANEPPGEGDFMLEGAATSFREAGHAVVRYALGLGCERIVSKATYTEGGEVYFGETFTSVHIRSFSSTGQSIVAQASL